MIGEHIKSVDTTLIELGVELSNATYKCNVRLLLRLSCSSIFGSATSFIDMLVQHIPSTKDVAAKKIEHIYTGPQDTLLVQAMQYYDLEGPLMVNVTKLYRKYDCSVFYSFGRVYSGTIQTWKTAWVLREGYSPDEEEDMAFKEITNMWAYQVRYRIPISKAPVGSWVLI